MTDSKSVEGNFVGARISLPGPNFNGILAHPVEHLTFNEGVTGSSPVGTATNRAVSLVG